MKQSKNQQLVQLIILNMKLQQFFQEYKKINIKTSPGSSPQRSHIFRTSQSIGTLDSHDEYATQRSFVVKQHNFVVDRQHEEIEHLREICTTQRNTRKNSKVVMCQGEHGQFQDGQDKQNLCYSIPFVKNDDSVVNIQPFSKNKGKASHEQISFEDFADERDSLYEQAPSALYEGCPTQQVISLKKEASWFMQTFNQLNSKMEMLQNQNKNLELKLHQSQNMFQLLSQNEQEIENEVLQFRAEVQSVIQQNIEIQNMIKQTLLRQQMQKYQFMSKQTTINNTKQPLSNFSGNQDTRYQIAKKY